MTPRVLRAAACAGLLAACAAPGDRSPGVITFQPPRPAYRALGHDPPWAVRIEDGTLRLSQPGQPDVTAAGIAVAGGPDGRRYAARTRPGLVLEAAPGPCRDIMSGMTFPDRAALTIDGARLAGCGGEPADLLHGRLWRVERLEDQPVVAGSDVEFQFHADGRLVGSGGCNRFAGGYRLTSEGLTLAPAAAGDRACGDLLQGQERRLFALFPRVRAFDLQADGRLALTDGHAVLLVAHGEPAAASPSPPA